MKELRQSEGFTLVELVIVLAVTALLLTGVLAGQGGKRESARFATSIDGIKAALNDQQNQAQRSVEQPVSRPNFGKSNIGVFGKIVEFDASTPKIYKVYTLILNQDNTGGLNQCDLETHNLPNGVLYKGSDPSGNGTGAGGVSTQDIIFTKVPAQMYVTPPVFSVVPIFPQPACGPAPPPPLYTNPLTPIPPAPSPLTPDSRVFNQSNYDAANAGSTTFLSPANLWFQANSKNAIIELTPQSNTIDRKFFE